MPDARTPEPASRPVTLFLAGDVMTGRAIDQILPHASDPQLYEPYVQDARDYLRLAEARSGPIPRPVAFAYPWGEALAELARRAPDLRIINLETAITDHPTPWPKGINYRMHPANLPCLTAAAIDCCVLANNHVLDWGRPGLAQTLAALDGAGIRHAGAGPSLEAARAPAVLHLPGQGRLLILAGGTTDCGIDRQWAAGSDRSGVHLLPDLSGSTIRAIATLVQTSKRPGDLVVASLHWGGNWGYAIPAAQREFAQALIDQAGVDLVHGHSSHHVKGIEVHNGRAIIYGCGDLLSDYEGISGYEAFRGELGLLYFPTLDPASGRLLGLTMTPTRVRRLAITLASRPEAQWLAAVLNREGRPLGTGVTLAEDGRLTLHWPGR
ncbi:MAG: CapA family protein [Thermodesulfobacteriota bacterium]